MEFSPEQANQEYDKFMIWFKTNHPELYEKYGQNIEPFFLDNGGVGINNRFKITEEEHQMLSEISKLYYSLGK